MMELSGVSTKLRKEKKKKEKFLGMIYELLEQKEKFYWTHALDLKVHVTTIK
jgi:hypothetical protein